jgi:1-acyl-sn-glycerol-3-phosphate acyltransferase
VPRLVPIQLRIGEPLPPPASRRKPDLEATTLELQRRINALLDQGLLSNRSH